ncbi:MAG: NAD(P)H-dependent flavin oxidoreductase [Gemmataceae bacterium]
MLNTRFTKLVGCSVPLQQAGMGGVAQVELAAAVARAGGLGMIGGVRLPAPFLADVLEEAGELTPGAIGVNFLMPFLDRAAVEIAAKRARVIEFFYADPDPELIKLVHVAGALACWQVGSVEEAQQAARAGCDFIVAQGVEAGGHVRGTLSLFPLLDQVLDAVAIPVVAAGGIGTARQVAAALAAGADAVRVGTRFVAARESQAHAFYKQALIAARGEDTIYTEAYSANWPNAPHRVLRSCIEAAGKLPAGPVGQTELAGNKLPIARFATPCPTVATTGKLEAMALYAGAGVAAVTSIQSAAEIVRELVEGAEPLLHRFS